MARYWLTIAGCLLLWAGTARADNDDEIAALKQQALEILARIEQLERGATPTAPAPAPAPADKPGKAKPAPAGWTETVRLGGDLRYRHESIDQQGSEERVRHRVRARVQVQAKPSDNTEVVVRLASGAPDPVSTNQTLGSGFSTKDLRLDMAYLKTSLGNGNAVLAGKMKNPLFMPGGSSLIWDSDLTPEGLAWTLKNDTFFAAAIGFSVAERSSASDSLLLGGQFGLNRTLADGVDLKAGIGYYDYTATKGRPVFAGAGGNSVDGGGNNYLFDYRLTEVFAQLTASLANMPLVAYVDWVNNSEGGAMDTGFAVGAKLGKASQPGQFDFGYSYRDLEANAVLGAFADSNVGGGGTGIRGHVLSLGTAITKKLGGRLTYIISENRVGMPNSRDYNRFQADVSIKY